ncbi:hypothetical protein PMG11_06575 [Penicillium brasilianum]|uniref:Uncharacterized protein n=1 Tax=Penicillium brasilianum TaxID=104259 RepID=A0A0F7TM94_PENBI|nr:hypothetical protein PMG11_06575 [Penicillium brasilianum]
MDVSFRYIEWKKGDYKGHWLISYFNNAMAFAIGYVPIIGPLLAIGWSVAYTAIAQPDEFADELREQIPSVELLEGFVTEIKKLAEDGEGVVQDGIDVKKLSGVETKISNASPLDDKKDAVQAKPAAVVEKPTGEDEQPPTQEDDEKTLTQADRISRMISRMKSTSDADTKRLFMMSYSKLDQLGLLTEEILHKLECAEDPFYEPPGNERWDHEGNFIEELPSADERYAKIARGLFIQMHGKRLDQAMKI